MNVSKITIGRLFNLGNYEHIRYEITAEIPAGESPATALIGLENILAGLNPKRPNGVLPVHLVEMLRHKLNDTLSATDESLAKEYGCSVENAREFVKEKLQQQIDEAEAAVEKWEFVQRKSRKLLEDLGGAANFTDAKKLWDDTYDVEF
ncbi:MAG TPA: hypothetical protein VGO57_09525 [Verrucomicrobiae bacterium]|jgi:hypothetical protein